MTTSVTRAASNFAVHQKRCMPIRQPTAYSLHGQSCYRSHIRNSFALEGSDKQRPFWPKETAASTLPARAIRQLLTHLQQIRSLESVAGAVVETRGESMTCAAFVAEMPCQLLDTCCKICMSTKHVHPLSCTKCVTQFDGAMRELSPTAGCGHISKICMSFFTKTNLTKQA